jgi:predicted molibdopterin-dependent oxidoreductase YjgC
VNRLHSALEALGDARPALLALTDLANAVGGADTWSYLHPDDVTNEMAKSVPGYEQFIAPGQWGQWGKHHVARTQASPSRSEVLPHMAAVRGEGSLILTTGRTLFTSLEGALVHDKDADKLHREEFVEIHPSDAASLRVSDEDEVTLVTDAGELAVRCKTSGRVREGVLFLPAYYDGGAVTRLLDRTGAPIAVQVKVAAPA